MHTVVKTTDFMVDFQKLREPGTRNPGAKALKFLQDIFDPHDLAAALDALLDFMAIKQTGPELDEHINKWKRAHRALLALYWPAGGSTPDWKQLCEELCTILFVRSLVPELAEAVMDQLKSKPRDEFSWDSAMQLAKADGRYKRAIADDRSGALPISAFAHEESANLARNADDKICTNCNEEGHSRGQCRKPCDVEIEGKNGQRRRCRGRNGSHDPECVLSEESKRRRSAKKDSRRVDRSSSTPPPAYRRQREGFRPREGQRDAQRGSYRPDFRRDQARRDARANLAQVETMKAEAQSKLVLDDTPKEVRLACLAQIQECEGQRDEIIAALAHIDSDDFDPLDDEDRALVFDDLIEPLPATVPVSGDEHAHATVDATDDDLAADKPATPNRHAHGT